MEESLQLSMARTWAEINLDNLEKNIKVLKGLLKNNAKFLGVCKANAYGHGMIQIAKKLEECKADMLAVASIQEGIELRKNGISIPILCFGQSSPDLTNLICKYEIIQTIENFETGKAFSQKALELNKKVKIHIKIDTGMGRLGFFGPKKEILIKTKKIKLPKKYQKCVICPDLNQKEFLPILPMVIMKNIQNLKLKNLMKY